MKKIALLIVVLLLSRYVVGQDSGLGLGVVIGEPTGLSAKLWTSERTALDAAAAWAFTNNGFFRVHADMLIHNFSIQVDKGKLPFYFGIGGKVVLSNTIGLGIRVPFGLDYLFASAPVDVFLEIAPTLNLLPATTFGFDGGIGIRYFF